MSRVFDLVLGIFREPGLVADLRDKELPENLSLVIRLAAGEGAALQCALDTTGESAQTLVDASVFFLQQVLFAPGNDAYRVLGADSDAPQERLRDNYRWLMKWLHPDRNQDGWEAVYADRVNVAWQDLKTLDRRANYDRRSPSTQALAPMTAASARRVVPVVPAPGGPLLSGATVRRLPMLVLGTLGMTAAAMIGITYWAQSAMQRELSELQRDRVPAGDRLSTSLDLARPEVSAVAEGAAATSAAVTALSAEIGEIDEFVADVAQVVALPPMPADEPAIADVPVISAAPVQTVAETEAVADIELAPVAMGAEPTAIAIQHSSAVPPAAAEATALEPVPPAADISSATGHGSTIALTRPAAAARLTPADRAPATPLRKAVEPTDVSREPAKVPVAPAIARESLPTQPAVAAPAATAREPVVAAASPQSPPDAPGPSAVIAALPLTSGVSPQPAPRDVTKVARTSMVESQAQSSLAVAPAPSGAAPVLAEVATAGAESSAPTMTDVAPPSPPPAQQDAEALVWEFASAYAAGDLARFDRLFTRASLEVGALKLMRSRFVSTELRYLEIQQLGWHAEPEQGRVRARFRDTYIPRGGRKAITESGVIEWTIRVDAGDARIASVARDNG